MKRRKVRLRKRIKRKSWILRWFRTRKSSAMCLRIRLSRTISMRRIGRKRLSNFLKTITISAFLISIRKRKERRPMGRTFNLQLRYLQSIVRKKTVTLWI